jgi:YD repeat-containing protein
MRHCTVILNYTLSAEEYLEAQQAYLARLAPKRMLFRNLYGLAGVAAALAAYWSFGGHRWLGAAGFLVALYLMVERVYQWRVRARKTYNENAAIREPVELHVDESSLRQVDRAGTSEIRWANIVACHETKNLFLLQLSREWMLMIPRRALSPGDLFRLKELFRQELIVKTTRTNPDVWLLKFVVSWGVGAILLVSLSLGFIYNFLDPAYPRYPRGTGSTYFSKRAPAEKPQVAQVSELRGSGSVYLVPIGNMDPATVRLMVDQFKKRYQLQLNVLPAFGPPAWAEDTPRKQFAAEDLVVAMQIMRPDLAADPSVVLIGITDADMYISASSQTYATSFQQEERYAVLSTAHLKEDEEGQAVSPELLETRIWKLLVRDVGILHYRLQKSMDSSSVLYEYVVDGEDVDEMGEDYLETDVLMRAGLHVQSGDPCFIVRHVTRADRPDVDAGMVADCSGYYRDRNLETVQIDLRYGLMMDQRTDFLIKDDIPLELTRVLRTQDRWPRAFGVGGNHNLNVFLVGDKWPFTWMDLILEHGGRAHFKRSNWGFGYWDARYTNRDAPGTKYSYSTIAWGWPGWKLQRGGWVYRFPDSGNATRPEQGALISIEDHRGKQLRLNRNRDGELLQARSPGGEELVFQYDSSHRIASVRSNEGERVEYSYDTSGHLARAIDAGQHVTEYNYDSSGRMTRVAQDGKEIVALEYDSADRVIAERLGNGRTYSLRYMGARPGAIASVDISDSTGPTRRVRISPADYTLNFVTPKTF